ncbi:hypothetical protein EDM59_09075 [Brevibacillus nitrificans]|uniref:Uncharacterized protein n=1 Tax=Brevibacillus nitrificans TaxID=651560 RepID=A0A3M8DMD0_9BACL|nr:hypothetical protein EDM59_09075 [Brevibacillus nitrificans]
MKLSAAALNVLLGIAGFYVFIFVLMTGGALSGSQAPSPSPLGYWIILFYFLIGCGANFLFARKASSPWRYCLLSVGIWIVSFVVTILV